MNVLTISELIIADARERGLRHFFGIPGGGSPLDMLDAGRRFGVDFVNINHESSAAIAAAHYGLMKETAGVVLSVKGVGLGNLVGGIANAYFERAPLLAVCECSPSSIQQGEMVQHCDHAGMVAGITKYRETLDPEKASAMIGQATFLANDGRPGPTLLNLPSNLGQAPCLGSLTARTVPESSILDETQLAAARKLLAASRRPVIVAGTDVVRAGASRELLTLVENIGAAVLVNMDARGVFPESHRRWAGVLTGAYAPNIIETEIFSQADLVLLIGADAMMTHVPWKVALPTCELVARPEYETLSPNPKVRVNGDLKAVIKGIELAAQPGFSEAEIQKARNRILQHFKRSARARLTTQDIIEIARKMLPPEGILVTETGAFVCMLEHLWPVEQTGTYLGTSGGRTMGLMVPAILGAKLARPDMPMIGLGGDGSLLMRLGELEVFARAGVRAPLVILNDQALGTMKSRQRARGMAEYGLDLHPVDFASIAKACELHGVTVDTPESFERELRLAMTADRATLIDARVDPRAYQDGFGPTIGVLA